MVATNNEKLNIKTELKLIKAISKIFPEVTGETENLKEGCGLMDPANVCMIYSNDAQVLDIIKRFNESDCIGIKAKESKRPELTYINREIESSMEICSKYSIQYLNSILACFYAIDESPQIFIKKDYPITLKGKYFTFVLAPRMDN